ncbi:hypothetical protein BST81_16810 [Leptolyngbya sp. 'hensonii']|uniref:hypothetical protein n=1 Tax=Leptolyngbya sp. 'hensonii' TaxID=1922337 RepID=UPI00094FEED5|nr:hypothetical protein [Leptolyngbya sp. 'hensonii']OLP17450.1 hypothetical protein BST81_16810 [Leptolyngbya sp. 'hensonii']
MTQVKTFNPIRLEEGQFRIALDLTSLGEQAWEVLKTAEHLGFPSPRFRQGEKFMWAVLVEEQHDFTTDCIEDVLAEWDEKVDQLRDSMGELENNLLVAGRFKRDLIASAPSHLDSDT